MQFGLIAGISSREPIERFSDLAVEAERVGFSTMWLTDSQLIHKNPYIAMTMAAERTSVLTFGPGVANPVTSHYSVLANTMSAIDEVSAGRALVGLGVGDSAITPLGLKPATLTELREAVDGVRRLTAGQEIEGPAGGYRVRAGTRKIPVFVSASQPRMLRLAGEIADGVIVMGGANRELTAWQIDHVREGAQAAGRTLDELTVDVWFALSLRDDRSAARDDVRAWATSQARWFHKWRQLPPVLEPYREQFRRAHELYDFGEHLSVHAAHSSAVSDELVDLLAPSGDVESCTEQIKTLADLPVDRITFTLLPGGGGRLKRITELGTSLLPALNASISATART